MLVLYYYPLKKASNEDRRDEKFIRLGETRSKKGLGIKCELSAEVIGYGRII